MMQGYLIAAPRNYHPLSYWLGRGVTAIVNLTLHARGLGLTLDERDNELTLHARTNALTLEVK